MSLPNQNISFDHKDTKIFVGGLAWRTTTDDLKRFFQQFGEVVDANVVTETCPRGRSRSKGYGFVTFRNPESAARACELPHPVIDGRQTNINLAYLRAKNNTNQSNQNGLLHQPGPSHQYQIGPVNQPNTQYIIPHLPQVHWDPNYGQYYYIYQNYAYPIPSVYKAGMQQNWSQRNNRRPVIISKPSQKSSPINEKLTNSNENEE